MGGGDKGDGSWAREETMGRGREKEMTGRGCEMETMGHRIAVCEMGPRSVSEGSSTCRSSAVCAACCGAEWEGDCSRDNSWPEVPRNDQ